MLQEFLKTRFATVVLSATLVLVMIITARILVQKKIVDREIAKLQVQMERIKKDNEQLSSLIQYLNTPEYQEKEAREKLNLRKEGEVVVVLPQEKIAAAGNEQNLSKPSNIKLWFDYFFNNVN